MKTFLLIVVLISLAGCKSSQLLHTSTPGNELFKVADYNKVIGQHRDSIVSDFKNYTNIQPVIQISEVRKIGRADTK